MIIFQTNAAQSNLTLIMWVTSDQWKEGQGLLSKLPREGCLVGPSLVCGKWKFEVNFATGACSWRRAGWHPPGKGRSPGRFLQESESFVVNVVFFFVFYCQCLIQSGRRKYSQINLSKLFESLYLQKRPFGNHHERKQISPFFPFEKGAEPKTKYARNNF